MNLAAHLLTGPAVRVTPRNTTNKNRKAGHVSASEETRLESAHFPTPAVVRTAAGEHGQGTHGIPSYPVLRNEKKMREIR